MLLFGKFGIPSIYNIISVNKFEDIKSSIHLMTSQLPAKNDYNYD